MGYKEELGKKSRKDDKGMKRIPGRRWRRTVKMKRSFGKMRRTVCIWGVVW